MLGTALNVNQALVTLAQGEVVKRLAGWAAVLAVPTLVASWYGMNFENMPALAGRYSYPILIGALAIGCFGLYCYLKRVRWLSVGATPPTLPISKVPGVEIGRASCRERVCQYV